MKVIAFGTLKGGTGKTMVAFNIAGVLAENHRVLLIDVDPQAHLSENVGIDTADQSGITVKNIFEDWKGTTPEDVITVSPMPLVPNIDVISSHIMLTYTERELTFTPDRERVLQKWIQRNEKALSVYDYIIIDTHPDIGIVNQNGFMIADSIILISDVSIRSIQGAELFSYFWGDICKKLDMPNNINALILNNCDNRISQTKEIKEYYKADEDFAHIIVDAIIPQRVHIKDTENKRLPINIIDPKSVGCAAFRNVVCELEVRGVL